MADIGACTTYVLRFEDRQLTGKVTTDRGGRTRFGIAEKYHPVLPTGFYTMPAADALILAKAIYNTGYATPLHLAELTCQPTANKLMDLGVNAGGSVSARLAQTAVCDLGNHIEIDGALGPNTVAALNSVNQPRLMDRLITLSQNFYREQALKLNAPADELQSWLTRALRPGI
jgi:lysozyme family protein